MLGFEFRRFPSSLALAILKKEHYVELDSAPVDAPPASMYFGIASNNSSCKWRSYDSNKKITDVVRTEVKEFFTAYDMKRLHAYAQDLVDYHLILDLLPSLARFYFLDRYVRASGMC